MNLMQQTKNLQSSYHHPMSAQGCLKSNKFSEELDEKPMKFFLVQLLVYIGDIMWTNAII